MVEEGWKVHHGREGVGDGRKGVEGVREGGRDGGGGGGGWKVGESTPCLSLVIDSIPISFQTEKSFFLKPHEP